MTETVYYITCGQFTGGLISTNAFGGNGKVITAAPFILKFVKPGTEIRLALKKIKEKYPRASIITVR